MRFGRGVIGRLVEEEPGQAALEMAFAMPLFLAVVFGMIQCSLVLQSYCNATYACRNAGRYAMLHSLTALAPSTASDIQTMVKSSLFKYSSIQPTVTVSYLNPTNLATSSNAVGQLVCVKASWSQKMYIPYMTTSSFTIGTQTCKIISR
jgi:Flp pilus assembly protein TadG